MTALGSRAATSASAAATVATGRSSRAPAATRKPDPAATTTTVVVIGDSMADWLAYGLEQAFTDTPEIAVLRKHRTHSGLIR